MLLDQVIGFVCKQYMRLFRNVFIICIARDSVFVQSDILQCNLNTQIN